MLNIGSFNFFLLYIVYDYIYNHNFMDQLSNMYSNILLTIVPKTVTWSPEIGLIMTACNLAVIVIGRYAIQVRSLGASIPILGLEGLGIPELLATASLGHAVGAGTIIGLASIGVLH